MEELFKENSFLFHGVNVMIHTISPRRVSQMQHPTSSVISTYPLSTTSSGEKCVDVYIPCAKDKPTNMNTFMCSGNIFPGTNWFETKQSKWSTQIFNGVHCETWHPTTLDSSVPCFPTLFLSDHGNTLTYTRREVKNVSILVESMENTFHARVAFESSVKLS